MEGESSIPARERARVELRECEALVRLLFRCFEMSASGRVQSDDVLQPEKITKQLVERQQALREVVDDLIEQQNLNELIERVRASLRNEEQKLITLREKLREAELSLQGPDDLHSERVAALEGAKSVKVSEVVEYAGKIGASYAAPPNWTPAEPLGNHLPPAPPEEMMRGGQLAQMVNEDQPT